jgi:DNA-binding LytR/AlgR family response regulator
MKNPLKILIVEDEMLIAANIANQLETLGYEVVGIIPRGEEAVKVVQNEKPDLILMDINLKGELNGIEAAKKIQQDGQIPIIYLTANNDDAHFERAKGTNPYAFISKPFKKLDLQRALELAFVRIIQESQEQKVESENLKLDDRIFVRHNEVMVKIIIADILYLEADRNYCNVYTKHSVYLLVNTLKNMEDKLPTEQFQRIHRSFIVNIKHVDEVAQNHLTVQNKILPLSKELRKDLLDRLLLV